VVPTQVSLSRSKISPVRQQRSVTRASTPPVKRAGRSSVHVRSTRAVAQPALPDSFCRLFSFSLSRQESWACASDLVSIAACVRPSLDTFCSHRGAYYDLADPMFLFLSHKEFFRSLMPPQGFVRCDSFGDSRVAHWSRSTCYRLDSLFSPCTQFSRLQRVLRPSLLQVRWCSVPSARVV
jgi:hypothetical protein